MVTTTEHAASILHQHITLFIAADFSFYTSSHKYRFKRNNASCFWHSNVESSSVFSALRSLTLKTFISVGKGDVSCWHVQRHTDTLTAGFIDTSHVQTVSLLESHSVTELTGSPGSWLLPTKSGRKSPAGVKEDVSNSFLLADQLILSS